ncbi:SCO family protein [Actinomarinicola tropica]|uniref:Redoxin domain-containing protein n=1 Tax=Actinomarinicola tropica TaxID=2789776 RepID=A0A5Q2RT12_9ACTN|nr:SCO family protein [Actinomarinicola tropica]QGG96345.1 redoxin domain-containing protein [Actinomarinicola tropica]
MRSTRRPARLLVAALALALLAGACSSDGDGDEQAAADASAFEGREMPEATPKPEFTLTDTNGDPYDFAAETEGKVTFLYFGYTFCPDICPVHLAQLSEVLSQPGMTPNVEVVFVTVDPERDTPEVIRDYLDNFSTSFVGLTGTSEELEAAQVAAGVTPAIKEPNEEDPEQYTMGHAGQVIAYAPNGLNYTQYPFGSRQSQFAHDIPVLDGLREPGAVPDA